MTFATDSWRKFVAFDGVSRDYNLPDLLFLASTDLDVGVLGADGVFTGWDLGVEYIIVGDGKTGGGVLRLILADVPVAGNTGVVIRDTDRRQQAVFVEGSGFPAKMNEGVLDRHAATLMETHFRERLGFRVPKYEQEPAVVPRKAQRLDRLAYFDPVTGDMIVTPITWSQLLQMIADAGDGGDGGGGSSRGYRQVTGGDPGTQQILPTDHMKPIYLDNNLADIAFTFDPDACDGVITVFKRFDSAENPHVTKMDGADFITTNKECVIVQIAFGELKELLRV